MKKLLLIFILLLTTISCKTIQTTQQDIQHDSIYITQTRVDSFFNFKIDSIYSRDSIYIIQYMKGDTCYIEKNKEHLEKQLSKNNEAKIQYRDSIVYKDRIIYRNITKTVTKKESFFTSIKRYLNSILWTLFAVVLVWLVIKYRSLIKNLMKKIYHRYMEWKLKRKVENKK